MNECMAGQQWSLLEGVHCSCLPRQHFSGLRSTLDLRSCHAVRVQSSSELLARGAASVTLGANSWWPGHLSYKVVAMAPRLELELVWRMVLTQSIWNNRAWRLNQWRLDEWLSVQLLLSVNRGEKPLDGTAMGQVFYSSLPPVILCGCKSFYSSLLFLKAQRPPRHRSGSVVLEGSLTPGSSVGY